MSRVVLFDIDGTILLSGGAGKRGMEQAFEEIFGVPDAFANIPMSGKTDPQILQEAFREHGISATHEQVEQFKKRYFELLEQNIRKDLPNKGVFPGVKELLLRLKGMDDVHVGLLTGNWRRGAEIKLGYFGLWDYFEFGAFGDDSIDRNELLPFALERFHKMKKTHPEVGPERVVVIGDTPNDIRCAHVHGARAVAVATGHYSVEELAAKGADLTLKNLENPDIIIDWIRSLR